MAAFDGEVEDVLTVENKPATTQPVPGTEVPDWLEDLGLWIALERFTPDKPAAKPKVKITPSAPTEALGARRDEDEACRARHASSLFRAPPFRFPSDYLPTVASASTLTVLSASWLSFWSASFSS